MLVLSRDIDKPTILFDLRPFGLGLVKVKVVQIRRDNVRIGIEADASIRVHRLEVFEANEEREKQE